MTEHQGTWAHGRNNPGDVIILLKEASSRKILLRVNGPIEIVYPQFIRQMEHIDSRLPSIDAIYEKFMEKTADVVIDGVRKGLDDFKKSNR